MTENNVVALRQKDEIDDPLTEILRSGARRLIEQAVEAVNGCLPEHPNGNTAAAFSPNFLPIN